MMLPRMPSCPSLSLPGATMIKHQDTPTRPPCLLCLHVKNQYPLVVTTNLKDRFLFHTVVFFYIYMTKPLTRLTN